MFLDRADLIRRDENGVNFQLIKFNLGTLLKNPETANNILLKPGDEVFVYKRDFLANKDVKIFGEIKNEGSYLYKNGMSIKDLILESGGLNKDIYRFKVSIFSINPYNEEFGKFGSVKDFNFDSVQLLKSNEQNKDGLNYKLSPHDVIIIFRDSYFSDQKSVTLAGQILFPGNYPLIHAEEKISDIIERSSRVATRSLSFCFKFFSKWGKN